MNLKIQLSARKKKKRMEEIKCLVEQNQAMFNNEE